MNAIDFKIQKNFLNQLFLQDGDDSMNMAEIKFDGWNGMDLYSLNAVKGYSTPMSISTDR